VPLILENPPLNVLLEGLAEPQRATLSSLITEQAERITTQAERIAEQEKRILILEEYRRLEALARFSSKSDKIAALSPNIQELFAAEPGLSEVEVDAALDQPAAQTEAEAAGLEKLVKQKRYKTKPHPGRAVFPPHLPRVDIIVDQAPAALADGTLPIVFLREVTERLNVTPASYFVERTTTVSYRFPNQPGAGIHRGPAPAALIFKSSLAPALVIEFIIHKYADHAPLYRQVLALERDHGIVLSYPTVDRQVITTAALAIPLADAIPAEIITTQYLQADETRIPVMDPAVKGKTASYYMWTYSHPRGGVVYRVHPGRGGKYVRKDLAGFRGKLQSDGYQVYQTLVKFLDGDVTHHACMSHVRRKFTDIVRANQAHLASSSIVAIANGIVARTGEIYQIEQTLKTAGADHAQRQQTRSELSLPLFDALISHLNKVGQDPDLLPGGALARACRYTLKLRAPLRRTLENGETEIDNNRCEQSIRPIALGRKNWLHVGSPQAAPSVAAIISVVETCKRIGVNVHDYLRSLLPQLAAAPPDQRATLATTLTPQKWKARLPVVEGAGTVC
jgi:transposase